MTPNGPIHHWTFDQGAFDLAGRIDTRLVGDARIVDDPKRGRVLELEGDRSYVRLGHGFKDFSKGITLAAWIYPTQENRNARVFEFSNNRWLQNISFGLRESGGLAFANFQDVSTARNPGPYNIGASNTYVLNQWQHVAAVLDSKRRVVLYHNGKPVGKKQLPIMPVLKKRTQNYIGISSWSIHYKKYGQIFCGRLDDLLIFDRPVTPAEIADLYEGQ